jgi:hypothetical protein
MDQKIFIHRIKQTGDPHARQFGRSPPHPNHFTRHGCQSRLPSAKEVIHSHSRACESMESARLANPRQMAVFPDLDETVG